jgi:two-component system chemotaxis sensor kinase CheA
MFGLSQVKNGKDQYVVVVQSGNKEMGIVVDSLIGQQEIVIKALDDYIGNSSGIAGATILGDGKVVLIVDVPDLIEKVSQQGWHEKKSEVAHA